MDTFFIVIGCVLLLLMIFPLYRLIKGPDVISRILGANVIGAKTTIIIVLIGTIYGRVEIFVDIAIGYALLSFITVLAAARLFQRARHLKPKGD